MSLPTPPETPQKLAQKQETLSNVYLYDKNDTSPIPLTYDVIDFGKPQGAASPLVGWATGAFFAVGGLWNFFNLNGEGTIFAGILLSAIGGLLIAAGFFMNGYSIIANANGFRSGTANSGEVTEWPVDRGYFTVKVRLGTNKTARMAMNSATLTITRPNNLPLSVQQVTFTGSNTAELKQRCEVQADRIWNWAVAKGYIFQSVLKARLTASQKSKDTLKRNAPRESYFQRRICYLLALAVYCCILLRRPRATRVVPATAITPATELASPVLGRTLFSRLGAGVWVASEAGTTGVGSSSG